LVEDIADMGEGEGRVLQSPPKRARHIQCFLSFKTSEQLFRLYKPYLIFMGIQKSIEKN
jgi:hypothetical protein